MTNEREILDLITDYVHGRTKIESGVSSDVASLDQIVAKFAEVLRRDSAVTEDKHGQIPPIVTRSDEEQGVGVIDSGRTDEHMR